VISAKQAVSDAEALFADAVGAGADIVVQSLHKADGGLCQASVMLVGGKLIDPVDLRLRLDLITTTSPSALLYGSIDGFRRRMVLEGRHLLDEALERTERIRDRLHGVPGLTVMDDSVIGHESVAEWDPLKLSVDVSALGITGYQARTWPLRARTRGSARRRPPGRVLPDVLSGLTTFDVAHIA